VRTWASVSGSAKVASLLKTTSGYASRRRQPQSWELVMTKEKRTDYLNRNSILSLLSDEETARFSSAETAAAFDIGDEFIDLAQLDRGIQRAGKSHPTESVLLRKAVHESTWKKIVSRLPPVAGA
jgi:hypothetical protein